MRRTTLLAFGIMLASTLLAQDSGKNAQGVTIFNEQCSGCHGPDGHAQTDMGKKVNAADLTSAAVQSMSESKVSKTVKEGKGKMPAFGDKLSDDDIKSVAAYVKQLGKSQ